MLFPNKGYHTAFALTALILLAGCGGFVNLKPIKYDLFPAYDNAILAEDSLPLKASFNTPMENIETEKIFSVRTADGIVKGDLDWQDNTLTFTPLEPWLPGTRYTMILNGTLYAKDGRQERINKNVFFYAVHQNAAPYCLEYYPANGQSVGVNSDEGAFIRLVFSKAMDTYSQDAFSLDRVSSLDFNWLENDTVLEVYPKTPLNPWSVYGWKLSAKAKCKDGVPLAREVQGQLVTDIDRLLPQVLSVFPLMQSDPDSPSRWLYAGVSLEYGLGAEQAIGIEFNKAMDETVLRNIRFDPSLAGRFEMWKETIAVFIPDRNPEPDTVYTLTVNAESRDLYGLKMEHEFKLNFYADIPYLEILSLDTGYGSSTVAHNGTYPVKITEPDGIITVIVRFSQVMDTNAKSELLLRLRLDPYFPAVLRPVSLRAAYWVSSDTVILQWEGIAKSTINNESGVKQQNYYLLTLPGGRSGINNGNGSYLKENTQYYLTGAFNE